MHIAHAVMRAVAAAAGRQRAFDVLPKSQHRRNQRKAEGSEQDEAEETTHSLALSVDLFAFCGKKIVRYWAEAGVVTAVEAQHSGPFAIALEDLFDATSKNDGGFAR